MTYPCNNHVPQSLDRFVISDTGQEDTKKPQTQPYDPNDIKHEHDIYGRFQSSEPSGDSIWPVQIRERYTWNELMPYSICQVKCVISFRARAFRDVLGWDVGSICDISWCIVSFAPVHHMNAVELVDSEFLCEPVNSAVQCVLCSRFC